MEAPDLSLLFDSCVATSASEVTPSEVRQLSELGIGETPAAFASWAEKRQREYRSGRHHARLALAAAGASDRCVRRDEDGVPLFPRGYHGSITHTGRSTTFAAAAVSATPLRVGLDAEELRDLPMDMIEYILTEGEIRRLTGTADGDGARLGGHLQTLGQLALLAFSAKEAFYKCVFPEIRRRVTFHQVDFRLTRPAGIVGSAPGTFELRLTSPMIEEAPQILSGKYLTDSRRVLCGVQWQP